MRPIALALVLASVLSAQSVPHTTALPEVVTGTFTGNGSTFPLGRTGGRMQCWYRHDCFRAPSLVTAIGPRPGKNATGTARTQSLEITMVNTVLDYSSFSTTFTQNLGGSVVVFTRKGVALPALSAQTNPDAPIVWILADVPFVLLGPNLIIQFDLGQAKGAVSVPYVCDSLVLGPIGKHLTSDPSCGGTLTAAAAMAFSLTLTGAVPAQPVWFLLSGNATDSAGLPLPYQLDALGMPGCLLSVDPQVVFAGVADAAGAASLSIPLGSRAYPWVVYGQAAHLSNANPFGLATTNLTRSVIGSFWYVSYIYNFTVDSPVAEYGPLATADTLLLK